MSKDIRSQQVGIDRRLRLEWLEATMRLVHENQPEDDIKNKLLTVVGDIISVKKAQGGRGSGEKAVTNLMRIWVRIPEPMLHLRNDALELFKRLPVDIHIALHWVMILAVYPFWEKVATQAGRLIKLQGKILPSQIQRRMKEIYGERPTVKDATRRALRSMHDWGVLNETESKGVYAQVIVIPIEDLKLI